MVDTATNDVVATIPVGGTPEGAAVTPDGSQVWVTNHDTDNISVISTATDTVVDTHATQDGPRGLTFMPGALSPDSLCAAPPAFGTLPGNNVQAKDGLTTIGTPGDDVIYGTAGVNNIAGMGGNDIIFAGDGDDKVSGGNGDDLLCGQAGKEQLTAGSGNDIGSGGAGDDEVSGGVGQDQLFGGLGADHLAGGTDADSCEPGGDPGDAAADC